MLEPWISQPLPISSGLPERCGTPHSLPTFEEVTRVLTIGQTWSGSSAIEWPAEIGSRTQMGRMPSQSDSGRKASRTEGCNISGVAKEWDEVKDVRDRVRSDGPILNPKSPKNQEDINVCIQNQEVLGPLLARMCLSSKKPPSRDALRDEVAAYLTLNNRQGPEVVVLVNETAETLKKLCVFIKAKTRRAEVSTATWT